MTVGELGVYPINLEARALTSLISEYKTALRSLGSANIFLWHGFDNIEHSFGATLAKLKVATGGF